MSETETTTEKACSTLFAGFSQPVEDKPLFDILKDIQQEKYKSEIEPIRLYFNQGNEDKADQLKKSLSAFTPSATFKGGRKPEFLVQYSGFVHLDFDKLPSDNLENIFQQVIGIPFTFACFRSPRGNGLKVFIKVMTGAEQHTLTYKQVQVYYEKILGIASDSKCKDITRLCFVSSDKDTFINPSPQIFIFTETESNFFESAGLPENTDYVTIFEQCKKFTENKASYLNGNRNNFIYMLASNCNRNGIPESEALQFILSSYDLSENESRNSVKSAYNNHSFEYAKFPKSANTQISKEEEATEDYLKQTPFIPDDIFNNLPELLKSGCSAFQDKRERDVFLTGALGILSGCLPNVKGVYAQQTVFPNLFCFIIAPAASGKGALKFSKMLADKEHSTLLQISREDVKCYDTEMNEYRNRQRSKKKGEESEDPPTQPPFKVLFIPANSSYAKILWHIEQNEGDGIICETEADTMGNVLKQDWGSYSDMLRKAFHHERLSSSKKANNEYIEVDSPRLSVALSGTPSQVTGLIASSEDGLFSRFLFYAFKVEQQWRDVSPYASKINLTEHFNELSESVVNLIMFLKQSPTEIELSKEQWDILNASCGQWLKEVVIFNGEDSASIVKRLGIILYRIAMIFTALRKFENGETSANVTCMDSDFEAALQLAQLFLDHSLFMFHNLPKQDQFNVFRGGSNKQKFFEELPKVFKRAEAIEIGKRHKLSVRTVDNLLKTLLGKYLSQETYGTYSKQ